jgi:hypothetical protein
MNLENLGVQEMSAQEINNVDGGHIVVDFLIWASGEFHDIQRGCEDALSEW